jgi:patatin-like phospholipase/acyl hydrolase
MSEHHDIEIWRAALSTSAAPSFFRPQTVGNDTLVDGGLGANNPVGWYDMIPVPAVNTTH